MRLAVDHKVVGVEAGRRLAEVAGLLSLSLSPASFRFYINSQLTVTVSQPVLQSNIGFLISIKDF